MYFTPNGVHHRNLEVLIVAEAVVAKMLSQFLAMDDRFGIVVKLDAQTVSHGNAVFHVEKEFLHGRQPWFVLFASQILFLNKTRSDTATCRC